MEHFVLEFFEVIEPMVWLELSVGGSRCCGFCGFCGFCVRLTWGGLSEYSLCFSVLMADLLCSRVLHYCLCAVRVMENWCVHVYLWLPPSSR